MYWILKNRHLITREDLTRIKMIRLFCALFKNFFFQHFFSNFHIWTQQVWRYKNSNKAFIIHRVLISEWYQYRLIFKVEIYIVSFWKWKYCIGLIYDMRSSNALSYLHSVEILIISSSVLRNANISESIVIAVHYKIITTKSFLLSMRFYPVVFFNVYYQRQCLCIVIEDAHCFPQ